MLNFRGTWSQNKNCKLNAYIHLLFFFTSIKNCWPNNSFNYNMIEIRQVLDGVSCVAAIVTGHKLALLTSVWCSISLIYSLKSFCVLFWETNGWTSILIFKWLLCTCLFYLDFLSHLIRYHWHWHLSCRYYAPSPGNIHFLFVLLESWNMFTPYTMLSLWETSYM